MFRGDCVDVHGVRVSGARGVRVGSILSVVLAESWISSQGSHETLPVVIKKNGFVAPSFDCFGDPFHRHDSFDQLRFQRFLIEVDEDSMIRIGC